MCNGLGFWIRKDETPSSPSTSTTTNETGGIDSDEDDYTDDISFNSMFSSSDNSTNSTESLEMSFDTSNDPSNYDLDQNMIVNGIFSDEEPNNLSLDIIDNWSTDVDEDLDPLTGEEIQLQIGVLMKKCRSIVKLINKSSILMNYVVNLKQQLNISRSLQLDCKSRWNSTHRLIESMLIYKKIINKINSEKHDIGLNKKQTNKISSIELDQFDWKMLELIEAVLKPFDQATRLVSGSQYPTIGIAYFALVQIREYLEDLNIVNINDWKILHHLKQILSNQIEKYFLVKQEQWDMMKVRIFVSVYIQLTIFYLLRIMHILIPSVTVV